MADEEASLIVVGVNKPVGNADGAVADAPATTEWPQVPNCSQPASLNG